MNYLEDDGMNPEELLSGSRPDESFAQLIKRAISSSPRQRLFLTEIYSWIIDNYPYFKQIDPGWRVNKAKTIVDVIDQKSMNFIFISY